MSRDAWGYLRRGDAARYSVRSADAAQESGLYHGCGAHACVGYRREHFHVQRVAIAPVAKAAISRARPIGASIPDLNALAALAAFAGKLSGSAAAEYRFRAPG